MLGVAGADALGRPSYMILQTSGSRIPAFKCSWVGRDNERGIRAPAFQRFSAL
jgi:hypothetical protein